MAYAFWNHEKDTHDFRTDFVRVLEDFTKVQKEQVVAQRVMNCLLTVDQKDRQNQLANCERIAR
jgi:hypothetical protein